MILCPSLLTPQLSERQLRNFESVVRPHNRSTALWLWSWRRTCGRCSVINPSAVTACHTPSGCDIFQHQSRNELASVLMANQGCRRGHTLARLLMAFSIKLEPPRCKIATLIGTSVSTARRADRQLMGFQHCFT